VTPASPSVLIDGDLGLLVGTSIQLKAITVDGRDATYAWSCSDEACARIGDSGLVTGLAPGTATIRATGLDTGASGEVDVVVSAWEEIDWSGLPHYPEWSASAHGDATAPAFHHWDADGAIPRDCAGCHSTPGFLDLIGADGSTAGVVNRAAPTGSVIDCTACHAERAMALVDVRFASGDEVDDAGLEALCMQCHQTRGSTPGVEEALAAAGVGDDVVSASLVLESPHYLGAGATRYGTRARGGYQYAGRRYDARFAHVRGHETCLDCHDPHSLAVDPARCAACHDGVIGVEDARDIRMASSTAPDYDGDGDREEGVHGEIQGLVARLESAVERYAEEVVGEPVAIDDDVYPYLFHDTNGNGVADGDEATYENRYAAWTPRLVRAAYNLLFALKDPGGYVHNAKYVMQLLHDSLEDVNGALPTPDDLSALVRDDPGHFDGSSLAARHGDAVGAVAGSCTDCHGESAGFLAALGLAPSVASVPPPNALDCATCHVDFVSYGLVAVDEVTFPGGATVRLGVETTSFPVDVKSFLCFTCHAGRAAKATIDAALPAVTSGGAPFPDVHHAPAAGVLFGSVTGIGYEYEGAAYAGKWTHTSMASCFSCHSRPHTWFHVPDPVDWWDHSSGADGSQCVVCHDPAATDHTFDTQDLIEVCQNCHFTYDAGADALVPPATPRDIRLTHTADYDGDGDAQEPLADELDTLASDLLDRIQTVAAAAGGPIAYDGETAPYYFHDTNGNGTADPSETVPGNAYSAWTEALVKAAHNHHLARRDRGAWVHNFSYTAQLLIDAIADLGGSVAAYVRPD